MRKFQSITIRNERQFKAFNGLPEKVFNLSPPAVYPVFGIGATATL